MARIYRSYIGLKLAPLSESGARMVPIAHFGAFEVRLVEFAESDQQDSLVLWIELYRYDTQSSIDSCLCRDLDEAENLGDYFISQARDYENLMTEPETAEVMQKPSMTPSARSPRRSAAGAGV
ncbi:MAG: hypothetical protein WCD69_28585 [Xanthobacteraceae bacterium]